MKSTIGLGFQVRSHDSPVIIQVVFCDNNGWISGARPKAKALQHEKNNPFVEFVVIISAKQQPHVS